MNSLNGSESKSVWMAHGAMPKFSPLAENLSVDVCVVGGGIAGLTTAYLLMKEGKKVCLLEAYQLASGQSSRTTAHFTTALDDRYFELENFHAVEGARLAAESHRAALHKLEAIVQEEKIDCEFEKIDGYLFAHEDPRSDVLQRELKAVHRAGLTDVEMVPKAPLEFFDTGPCLKFTGQIQIHPVKYLAALADRLIKGRGLIYTGTHVSEIQGGKSAFVKTDHGYQVNAREIVVATNTPVNDLFAIHTKQAPYRTYVMSFKIPKGTVPRALYWDTLDPYHYIRLASMDSETHEALVIGGEDHKTGQDDLPEKRFERLESWTRKRFPMVTEVLYRWSGQVMEPVDCLAFLGHNPLDRNNVYIITGDSGNGMTHSTIGAMLITDQIMGRKNRWEELYSPSRISLKAAGEFLKENVNVVAQYGDWFSSKPLPDFFHLPRGEGTVFRDGAWMIATYKDLDGNIELMSAACSHLKGVVHWNTFEKTWDCPCHGSRFDQRGKVIEGPAIKDLAPIRNTSESIPAEKPPVFTTRDTEPNPGAPA